jgi:putative ABC transport system ATP-binding protein
MLEAVGLGDKVDRFPSQLSGGEQQRVAIARAFITNPQILFADEPTGNLDEETASTITELLFQMNKEEKTTLVLVTHNIPLARNTGRILKLKQGKLEEDMLVN